LKKPNQTDVFEKTLKKSVLQKKHFFLVKTDYGTDLPKKIILSKYIVFCLVILSKKQFSKTGFRFSYQRKFKKREIN